MTTASLREAPHESRSPLRLGWVDVLLLLLGALMSLWFIHGPVE